MGCKMKKRLTMTAITAMMIITAILLTACEGKSTEDKEKTERLPPANTCEIDEDCICGGIDKATGNCFIGNKVYYEINVDKSKTCPDFCTGIDGNMVVKCINSRCQQTYECVMDFDCAEGQICKNNKCFGKSTEKEGCSSDKDCMTGGCSGTICQSRNEEPVFTTCEYRDEYSCYKEIECGCVEGKCLWKKTAEFELCYDEKSRQAADGPV